MLIKNEEVTARLNNPFNLINRMKNSKSEAMSLFIRPTSVADVHKETTPTFVNPFKEPSQPSVEELVKDSSKDIALATAHDEALGLLNDSLKEMRNKVSEIDPDKLPSVINASSKVVESIRKERTERDKNKKGQDVHYHFYTPVQKSMEEYEVIEVG